jgi:RNA polymerase sigma-70 factor (ECF subfamily)
MSNMLDQAAMLALVVRAQHGDKAAFSGLVSSFLRACYSVALAIVGRPADAEDVAQDALVVALERIGDCRQPDRFAGWLLQIVRNQARNWLARRRLRDVASHEQLPHGRSLGAVDPTQPEQAGLKARLVAALSHLSEAQREVVLLHDLEEWTHQEIGQALGISEVMSRQHLFVARRILRGRLAPEAVAKVSHEGR